MRIEAITLKSFRSHKHTVLDMPSVTIVRGANHSGKSSIVQAIELALAGRCQATDERGAGAGALIRTGENISDIVVTLVDPQNGTRLVHCELSLDKGKVLDASNPDDPSNLGTEFLHYLKGQSDTLSCLIDTRHFIEKTPAEQKDILANIVLPTQYDFPKNRRDQCEEVELRGINWNLPPVHVIAAAYKAAYEARTGVNRAVKQFQMPTGSVAEAGDETEIRTKLTERKNELEAVRRRANAEVNDANLHAEKLRNATQRISMAESRLSTEQQDLHAIKKDVLPKTKVSDLEKMAKGEAESKRLAIVIAEKTTEGHLRKQDFDRINKLGENLACPTCAQTIPQEMLARLAEPIVAARNTLADEIKEAQDQMKALGDWQGAKDNLQKHKYATEEVAKLERRVAQASDEITAARAAKEALEADVPQKDASLADQIADLQERVTKGEGVLQRRIAANQLKLTITSMEERQAKLLKHQVILEELVKYFGAGEKSAMTALLAAHIQPFQDAMNEVLGQWGYQCTLNFEPFVFGITMGGKTYALHLLSESEQYQFAIAFQVALARTSGLLFVIVDATEIFDAAGRKAMMLGLLAAQLDQIIVLATDERTEIPALPHSAFYMLSCTDENSVPTTTVEQLA